MFEQLWNYFKGYVMINVSGFSVERFMNMASFRKIHMWDVIHEGGIVSMKIKAKDILKLKDCAKKTGCKIKIVKKEGIPFIKHRYRKRKVLLLGGAIFVLSLYFMSTFVWLVEIEGNARIPKESLMIFCEELGIKPGVFKFTIDTKKCADKFIEQFADLSWIAININGTKVKIDLVETIKKPELIDKASPCDIVAKTDALITDVVVINGTPVIKPKNVVRKGDLLVSGKLEIKDDQQVLGYRYIHAKAEVYGKVWYEIKLSEPLEYIEKIYTGQKKKKYAVEFFGNEINFFLDNKPYKEFDKITLSNRLEFGDDIALPIVFTTYEFREYVKEKKKRTYSEAVDILNRKIDDIINKKLEVPGEEVIIMDKNVLFSSQEMSKDKVEVKAIVASVERIDVEKAVSESEIIQMPEFAPKNNEDNVNTANSI